MGFSPGPGLGSFQIQGQPKRNIHQLVRDAGRGGLALRTNPDLAIKTGGGKTSSQTPERVTSSKIRQSETSTRIQVPATSFETSVSRKRFD